MLNDNIQPLDIKSFLSQDQYRIPIYQRNYDWGEKQSLQLIEDIADYASIKKDKKYYIGSAVVFARSNGSEEYYETIDGQQRLTTIRIVLALEKLIDRFNSFIVIRHIENKIMFNVIFWNNTCTKMCTCSLTFNFHKSNIIFFISFYIAHIFI